MTLHTLSVQTLSTLRSLGHRLQARLVQKPLAAAIVLALAWVYVRTAERNERDFADVVERSGPRPQR